MFKIHSHNIEICPKNIFLLPCRAAEHEFVPVFLEYLDLLRGEPLVDEDADGREARGGAKDGVGEALEVGGNLEIPFCKHFKVTM